MGVPIGSVGGDCGPATHPDFQLCVSTERIVVDDPRLAVQVGCLLAASVAGLVAWRGWRRAYLHDGRVADPFWVRRDYKHRVGIVAVAALVPFAVGAIDTDVSSRYESAPLECKPLAGGQPSERCWSERVEVGRSVTEGADHAQPMLLVGYGILFAAVQWWAYVAAAEFLARRTSAELVWRRSLAQWRRAASFDRVEDAGVPW